MQTLLQKWGINVVLANNWDDALKVCETIQPQILLMDYQLSHDSEKNGLDLIEEIRHRLNIVVPAALITATPDESLVTQCKAQGVNFLAKPLKPAKLRTTSEQALHQGGEKRVATARCRFSLYG